MEEYTENGNRGKSHPVLIRIIGIAVVVLVSGAIKLLPGFIEALNQQPEFVIEKSVEDTGEYLDNTVYFSPKENIGKRFLLACKPQNNYYKYDSSKKEKADRKSSNLPPEKTDDGNLYYFVTNLRNQELEYVLLSGEKLNESNYTELDCLVTGYYHFYLENSITNQKSERSIPILRFLSVKKDNIRMMDYAAPLITTDKPDISVKKEGVTLTLSKVEYRENICRAFLTLKNDSKYIVNHTGLCAEQNSSTISGTQIVTKWLRNSSIQKYYEDKDETLLPTEIKQKGKHNAVIVTEVMNKDDEPVPVHFKTKMFFYTGKSPTPEKEYELVLKYDPIKKAATPDSK